MLEEDIGPAPSLFTLLPPPPAAGPRQNLSLSSVLSLSQVGFAVFPLFYLSMSLTRLWRRSLRSKILISRISMALCISESMRSRSSRELFRFCSEFWMRRSNSELRISVSYRGKEAKEDKKQGKLLTNVDII